jgi:hypothetical protein
MNRFALGLMLTATAAFGATWNGTISDSKCAAAHADASEKSAACAQKCVKSGQQAVLVSDGKVYKIANQKKVLEHVGHKVEISGKARGETITVSKVKMTS